MSEEKEEIKLVVIDTPRGKVPLADSLENILRAFNKILLRTNDNLDKLAEILNNFGNKLQDLLRILKHVESTQEKILELLLEINAKIESVKEEKIISVKKTEEEKIPLIEIKKTTNISPTFLLKLSEILRENGFAVVVGNIDKARALIRTYADKVGRKAAEIDGTRIKLLENYFEKLEEILSEKIVVLIKNADKVWGRNASMSELSHLTLFLKNSIKRIGLLIMHYDNKENVPEIISNKAIITLT